MAKEEIFTDLLAAVAESLKNSTRHLSLEAGINQSGAVKILQKRRWHHYTTQVYKYHNEDNQFGESNCTHKIQIQTDKILFKDEANFCIWGNKSTKLAIPVKFSVDERQNYKHLLCPYLCTFIFLLRFHIPFHFPHCVRQGHAFWRTPRTHASTCPHLCVSSCSTCNKCRRWIRWRHLMLLR